MSSLDDERIGRAMVAQTHGDLYELLSDTPRSLIPSSLPWVKTSVQVNRSVVDILVGGVSIMTTIVFLFCFLVAAMTNSAILVGMIVGSTGTAILAAATTYFMRRRQGEHRTHLITDPRNVLPPGSFSAGR